MASDAYPAGTLPAQQRSGERPRPPQPPRRPTTQASTTTVFQSRTQDHPATRDHIARRSTEGKTSREINRCLSRYVARDLYRLVEKRDDRA